VLRKKGQRFQERTLNRVLGAVKFEVHGGVQH